MTTKVCTKCNIEKSIEDFYPTGNKDYVNSVCKSCYKARSTARHNRIKHTDNHKRMVRNNFLKYEYGITLEEYNTMFAEQKGCCAGCKVHQSVIGKTLSVDHNHETGKVRELLCSQCNSVLGYSKENLDTLQNAINYLKKHQNTN